MSPSQRRLEDLVGLLESEFRIYEELRTLLQEEREHMAALDARRLAQVVEAKEMAAAEARFMEESRLQVARALAEEIGLASERPTLSELSAALGPDAVRLREVHVRLAAVLGAVRELMDANASFAGDSLGQVRDALRTFGRMAPVQATYEPGHRPTAVAAPGRLLRRSV
ncbi:MAG: flagellar protein FlgN [Myxococcota bacterium]